MGLTVEMMGIEGWRLRERSGFSGVVREMGMKGMWCKGDGYEEYVV